MGTEASLHPNWSFVAALGLRATLARLAGASSSESVQVGQLTGVVPDLSLQLGPRLVAGWLVVAPHASGGLTLSDWEARITNESAVQFGGFWLGAGLEVGVIWGPGK